MYIWTYLLLNRKLTRLQAKREKCEQANNMDLEISLWLLFTRLIIDFHAHLCLFRCDVWSGALLHTGAQWHHRCTGAASHAPLPGERPPPNYNTVEAQRPAVNSGPASHHLHQWLAPDQSLPEDQIWQLIWWGRLRVRGPEFFRAGGEPQGPNSGSQ